VRVTIKESAFFSFGQSGERSQLGLTHWAFDVFWHSGIPSGLLVGFDN
jgi:hypothetical protein